MGGKEHEKGEGARRIMVNSDEELIEALKEINKTLAIKSENIHQIKRENIKQGRNRSAYRVVKEGR
jgi:hypothetical protein